MFNFLKKNKPIEKKSHAFSNSQLISSLIVSSEDVSRRFLTPQKALFYYDLVAPVATAIDLINDEFKNLQIALETNGEITIDDDILNFLKQPNDDMVLIDFLETMGIYFLATNEVYIIATGTPSQAPAELIVVSPELVEVKKNRDGFISSIEVQSTSGPKWIFNRADDQFRFFTKDGNQEIWQIKGFNSKQTGRGKSKLTSVSYEIDQYLQVAIHNLSLLKNGMRPSGAFSTPPDTTLDDDQFERLKEQIENFYSGGENAGNTLVLDNGLEFKEMGINPKDMDFLNMNKSVSIAIFNRYKVPLPLVNPDKMTLSNMDSAKLNLYDNAVLPFANRMFAELTAFLRPRFKLSEESTIVPFKDKITALQMRRNEELKLKKELGIFTINQLLAEVGEDSISQGGDTVFILNNLVPAGATIVENPTIGEEAKTTRESFRKIMKMQIDVKGNRSFTDDDIERIADEEGL